MCADSLQLVKVSIARLFFSFLRLGMTAFGGPAMIAHMKALAKCNKWLNEETFKNGVVLCQSIPGATAMQMAAYIGLRSRGIPGALATYTGFGLPAFILMLTLAIFYAGSRSFPQVVSLFNGLQVMVVAIIAHATFSFGRDILKSYGDTFITAASAVLFWYGMSPFAVITGAAMTGPIVFKNIAPLPRCSHGAENTSRTVRQVIVFILLVCGGLAWLSYMDKKLFSLAALMLRIDLFAFGGGFASLPLMFHEVVDVRGWLDGRMFMDGIALGQITPGPIVITATFVGYMVHGLLGAVMATMAIFTPSFVILVAVTPFFDRLKHTRYFAAATRGILASFVGLLLYMAVKFALAVPWEITRVIFGVAVAVALVKKVNILYVVLIGAAISVLLFK
jgi:chromate transporter